jgi:anti-sigma B factor antagonist
MTGDPAAFSVSRSEDEQGTVIEARGELDLAVSAELESALADGALAGNGAVVLDLTELTFMDSSGLRVILVAAQRFERSGRAWAIVLPEESPVRRILSLSETEQRLPIKPDRDQALASLPKSAA